MRIELAGWESQGLRSPDITVNLTRAGAVPHVTLIQMPNGTGKTTTLTMIRAAMSGEALEWSPEKIISMRQPGENNSIGKFILKLLIDGRPLTFEVTLDFDSGSVQYRTTSPGSGGITKGWHPPQSVRRFLEKKFVKLFIFDGEFADRLIDTRHSEAESAIDALCQLYLLEEISNKAVDTWQRVAQTKRTTTDQGLNRHKNTREKLIAQIGKVETARTAAISQIAENRTRIAELEEKINARMGAQTDLRNEYEKQLQNLHEAQKTVDNHSVALMSFIRQPQALSTYFSESLRILKSNLDRLKLPSSTSSQFFAELLEETDCICGRTLDEQSRLIISDRMKLYLGEETSGILNTLKQDIGLYVNVPDAVTQEDLNKKLIELDTAMSVYKAADTHVRAIRDKLIERGDEELKAWEAEYEQKKLKVGELDEFVRDIDRDASPEDGDDSHCLKSLRRNLREIENKISEATGTLELKEKTDILQSIVASALQKARSYIKSDLTKECNARLQRILVRNPVTIQGIEGAVKLRDQDGASVGQTLSVGYTFLTSLLFRGKNQFPLVVDSPANPLSIEVRREIGSLIPQLCEQFVGFTISSEREGFVSALSKNADKRIEYLTIFRKTKGTDSLLAAIPKRHSVETDNGVLVADPTYFSQFDKDEEGDN